ncbi:helix-turn-helix domain-containing protein [Natronorubrum sulfidifaciens]|uniref:Bacterio-opsin activator HTH domain protein n=1 Tax=Natronorubrum sulfidifaciens JCM 14089 TaxID=1230460 RepID=L9W5D0_9EURY|nr:helix-turn-helix domain-containing protein [Natronorubrum sulfidifaciens]ELY44552.1 Bacterio-opsin activator HTH domain protein [Natronorubrum sulfidifaciens JCM 14089]
MGFIAEIHLSHDDLVLVPTIKRHPDTTLRYEYTTPTGGRDTQFISAFGDDYAALEGAMEADHTISNPTRVATFENRVIYRVTTETDIEIIPDRCTEGDLFVFTVTSTTGGWVARVHLPDRDALAAFRSCCRSYGISFRVSQLYDSSVSDEGTYVLSEQQYEILTLAYYAGYFDVPRECTQDDLADQFEISDSAVSQRLRRAISDLIAGTIENDRTPTDYE